MTDVRTAAAVAALGVLASAGRCGAGETGGEKGPVPRWDYRGAAAHYPRFADRALWPKLRGKEYFLKSAWPKGRRLVWRHPGRSGGPRFRGALSATDPKNWLEDGRPCEKFVLDETADLLLPASEAPYRVGFRGTGVREVCRHVTIERNAAFVGGGDGVGRNIHGNVWVKVGGGMDAQGATCFLGGRHTFFRNDNTAASARSSGRGGGIMSSQYFVFQKDNGASVEFLGHVTVLDEFRVYGCTVIVGADSTLQPGRNASPTIDRGGVLALMDGATFESWNNDFSVPEIIVRDGAIQGGLPDRPLRRSCRFGLAFKNHTAAKYTGPRPPKRGLPRVPGLVVLKGALRSYSTDVRKARLVFTEMANQDICPRPGTERYERDVKRWPENKPLYAWLSKLPRGLDCYLSREATVAGVEFDHLRKGGILCQDLAGRARWKDLFFGPGCRAGRADLFSSLDATMGRRVQY